MSLLSNGNLKVKGAYLWNLPTSTCHTKCPSCYARRSELRFKKCLESRNRNLDISKQDNFAEILSKEINKSKRHNIIRFHESGDIYSQEYLDKLTNITLNCPDKKFYMYTKVKDKYDFSKIEKLKNINIINSLTKDNKVNYGDQKYLDKLKDLGYKQCPCKKGIHIACMVDCKMCLSESKVSFLKH